MNLMDGCTRPVALGQVPLVQGPLVQGPRALGLRALAQGPWALARMAPRPAGRAQARVAG